MEDRPYAQIGYIPNPANLIAPRSYPPVFPCLLAPVYGWLGLNLTAMKIELILCFLLSLLMIFFVLRADRPSTPARRRLLYALLAGVTALLACETR